MIKKIEIKNDTIEDLKDFNSKSLSTRAGKGKKLLSMMPATKKVFDLMDDDIITLKIEKETLKNQIGDY